MTRIELGGLMLGLLAVSVAGGISWRLFRPHRGAHVYDLAPVPIPRLEYGSMILEEETRLRGDWQDAYVRELAPETLDEEADRGELPRFGSPDGPDDADDQRTETRVGLPGLLVPDRGESAAHGNGLGHAPAPVRPRSDGGTRRDEAGQGPEQAARDLLSMMSDEDFFHMARFEFRRLEWMASEPLTLPAWTGRAA